MSTGADCKFIEIEPGKWKYAIQRWPYGEWPEYETNGPFNSYREAMTHLSQNYANPGGWFTSIHDSHKHERDEYDPTICLACGETL